MPIYEYRCLACEHEFEEIQKISDSPISVCPSCQKEAVTRLVSATAFQLKGNGWYVTDFRDKKTNKKENKSDTTNRGQNTDKAHDTPKTAEKVADKKEKT